MKILTNRRYNELLQELDAVSDFYETEKAQLKMNEEMWKKILEEFGIEIVSDEIKPHIAPYDPNAFISFDFDKARYIHLKKGKKEKYVCQKVINE